MHGEDDQIVPYENSAPLAVKLLKDGTAEDLRRLSRTGAMTTHPDEINADILAFIRGEQVGVPADEAPAIVAEPLPA